MSSVCFQVTGQFTAQPETTVSISQRTHVSIPQRLEIQCCDPLRIRYSSSCSCLLAFDYSDSSRSYPLIILSLPRPVRESVPKHPYPPISLLLRSLILDEISQENNIFGRPATNIPINIDGMLPPEKKIGCSHKFHIIR